MITEVVKVSLEYMACYSTAFLLGFVAGVGLTVTTISIWRANDAER